MLPSLNTSAICSSTWRFNPGLLRSHASRVLGDISSGTRSLLSSITSAGSEGEVFWSYKALCAQDPASFYCMWPTHCVIGLLNNDWPIIRDCSLCTKIHDHTLYCVGQLKLICLFAGDSLSVFQGSAATNPTQVHNRARNLLCLEPSLCRRVTCSHLWS